MDHDLLESPPEESTFGLDVEQGQARFLLFKRSLISKRLD
jgi:hypothetical protein